MARRGSRLIKSEMQPAETVVVPLDVDVQQQIPHTCPVSSGDTIVDSSDSTMHEDAPMIDESYHTKIGAQKKDHSTTDKDQLRTRGPAPQMNPNGGLQVLGRGVKELVQAVQALRHLGVEDLVLPLPKVVVVGDQSTGKSSLIEGISEIKVPRNTGTCTRCPLEINLSETNDSWSCKVSLFKKYVYEGNLGSRRVLGRSATKLEGPTRNRPLGPWRLQEPEEFHFATITSKLDVEDVLYLAQLATLNPGSSYEKYLPGNPRPKEEHQVKFSPNVVRLDISGPGIPNLSFTDLPGVINVSELPDEDYLVDLVKNLVKEYINVDDCINLLALPMNDDPANSSASRLVRELRAEGRTVGCLTKPDRMQEGESLEQWIQILGGKRFRLGFDYHVIKNNPDPRVDHSTARNEEVVFFRDHEPWSTIFKPYKSRFGTLQLQAALSERLTAQIQKSLPRIIEKVQQKAEVIDAELRKLPEPLSGNLPAIVYGELMKFESEVAKHIDGGSQAFPFHKEWHQMALQFRKMLADSRPILMLPAAQRPSQNRSFLDTPFGSAAGTPTPANRRNVTPIAVDSDDDDENEASTEPIVIRNSGSKRPNTSAQSIPNKLPRMVNNTPRSNANTGLAKRFQLAEIRGIIQDAYIGIPDQNDPKATERMIQLSMAHWEGPVDRFLNSTKELFETMIHQQVLKVFGHRQQTRYFDQILGVCETFFETMFAQHRELVKRLLSWELSKPKTLNDEALALTREKAFNLLQIKRREARAIAFVEEQEARTGKITSGQSRNEKVSKVLDSQLQPEIYTLEIQAMSVVKGYYDCAFSRFVDVVYASIHSEVFTKCRNELANALKSKFGVTEPGADERCALLMAVNADDEERRVQLKKEKETIQKAQERLEGLSNEDPSD